MECFYVDESSDSKRLDVVLAQHDKVSSRAEAQRIIKGGLVQINQTAQAITPKQIVRMGDVVTFSIPTPAQSELIPVAHHLDIVYEDQYLLIVNKPKGMVVHPAAGHFDDTLVNHLLHHTGLSEIDPARPGIVHRIDKDTSGLLVVAKENETHNKLAALFSTHQITRAYEALVWGQPKTTHGTIDQPLGRHPSDRKKFSIRENGKHAVTHWRLIKGYNYLSLLECKLETGRTHQIRVHLNSIGHSLLGDPVYGKYRHYSGKMDASLLSLLKHYQGQALHAKSLGFSHPITGDQLHFSVPLPESMQTVIAALEEQQKG